MKKLLLLLVFILTISSFAACGEKTETSASSNHNSNSWNYELPEDKFD